MKRDAAPAPAAAATLRLDKWLWFARFAKSRALAARLCAAGAVSVDGAAILKASHPVRVGDSLRVPRGRLVHSLRILALGSRRGPAAEARLLYIETALPQAIAEPAWAPLLDDGDAG
jgi:ribosome-associated heat shock protein Hsp15